MCLFVSLGQGAFKVFFCFTTGSLYKCFSLQVVACLVHVVFEPYHNFGFILINHTTLHEALKTYSDYEHPSIPAFASINITGIYCSRTWEYTNGNIRFRIFTLPLVYFHVLQFIRVHIYVYKKSNLNLNI